MYKLVVIVFLVYCYLYVRRREKEAYFIDEESTIPSLTLQNLDTIMTTTNNKIVVLLFYIKGNEWSRRIFDTMNQFHDKYSQFIVAKLDADGQPLLISKFGVRLFPTVLFLIPKQFKKEVKEEDEDEDAMQLEHVVVSEMEKVIKYMESLLRQFKVEKPNPTNSITNWKSKFAKMIEYDFYNYPKPFDFETLELFAKKKLLLHAT